MKKAAPCETTFLALPRRKSLNREPNRHHEPEVARRSSLRPRTADISFMKGASGCPRAAAVEPNPMGRVECRPLTQPAQESPAICTHAHFPASLAISPVRPHNSGMNTTKTFTLDEMIAAIRSLPAPSQRQLVGEIMQRVDDLNTSKLTHEQREIVKERMSQPREHVSRDHILSLLRRYNPAL